MRLVAVLALIAVACGAPQRVRSTQDGSVSGLTRDHDSGDPIAKAEIRLTTPAKPPHVTTSNELGTYQIEKVAPGTYEVSAVFAGQTIRIKNVVVKAGAETFVDVMFTLGRPEPLNVDYNDRASEIGRYRPKALSASASIIEGTVSDAGTRERVPGAVVTAVTGSVTEQTVTDDQGRYKFEAVTPGTYAVSAYYSIGGRGQIEVRRSDIAVEGAEAVVVPLWIELTR